MFRRLVCLAVLLCGWTSFRVASAYGVIAVAETKQRVGSLTSSDDNSRKLSPMLLATRDSGGAFLGTDAKDRAVFDLPDEPMFASLTASVAVARRPRELATVATFDAIDAVEGLKPVRRLLLSYGAEPPSAAALGEIGLTIEEDYKPGKFVVVRAERIDGKLVSALERLPNLEYAAPQIRFRAVPPQDPRGQTAPPPLTSSTPPVDDPKWNDLWGLRNMNATSAWSVTQGGDVVVAVIDTGVDYDHEDLKDNMWTNSHGHHGRDFVQNDDLPMDVYKHGTHCAGIIGAFANNSKHVAGVNWRVKIMAVRWLDNHGHGNVANAVKAIDYAIDNGARIINASWYWHEHSVALEAAIKRARDKGVLFVTAAGNFASSGNHDGDNDHVDTTPRYPSVYDASNIISVASIDINNDKASNSHYGRETVDLAAPGVGIRSTHPNHTTDFDSGTSMAAAHVSGAAALILARRPDKTMTELKDLLLQNVRKIPAMTGKCVSEGTLDVSFVPGL
ncbi:MAG: S8 family serine peptidase [Planctomycetales bacterium]|nr:S8 family serine peptidase [Planctomycetales bacterium]MBN8626319.1 S8 family serine peptidase [Planctomycetota bacterium]